MAIAVKIVNIRLVSKNVVIFVAETKSSSNTDYLRNQGVVKVEKSEKNPQIERGNGIITQ